MNINKIFYIIKNSNLKSTTKSFLTEVLKTAYLGDNFQSTLPVETEEEQFQRLNPGLEELGDMGNVEYPDVQSPELARGVGYKPFPKNNDGKPYAGMFEK